MGEQERRAYLEAIRARYRRAGKAGKTRHTRRVLRGLRISPQIRIEAVEPQAGATQ